MNANTIHNNVKKYILKINQTIKKRKNASFIIRIITTPVRNIFFEIKYRNN